jgi:hypothetical protein
MGRRIQNPTRFDPRPYNIFWNNGPLIHMSLSSYLTWHDGACRIRRIQDHGMMMVDVVVFDMSKGGEKRASVIETRYTFG